MLLSIAISIGIIFLLLEIFIPSMFFINLSLAAFICAIVSIFYKSTIGLLIIFSILSLFFILVLRPLFQRKDNDKEQTGIQEKYIGKIAKSTEEITKDKGVISIYDERWQARNVEDTTIEANQNVEIVGYENLIMKVKKAD